MFPEPVRETDQVLINGPLFSGKRTLLHCLLREWGEEPVVISTRREAERARRDHERSTGCDGDELVVVDCVSAAHGEDPTDDPQTKYAAGPGNLTDIGTTYTDVLEQHSGDGAVGITSVSPLVMYASLEEVYRFTQLAVHQAVGEGYPIAAVVESETHEDRAVNTIREPFDAIVETRTGEDGNQFRARTREGATEWQSIDEE